jgi:tRNA pseudouridine55 synthase
VGFAGGYFHPRQSHKGDVTGEPSGLLVIDKEPGWTSHDVVAKTRGLIGTRKVGHAGTLDPDATGVLLVGVGKVTRLLRFLSELSKTYTGEIVLGVETSTLDASGDVTATYDMTNTTIDDVRRATTTLTGPIMQVPPMVSAVQVGGQRLHELARKGIEVEREPRPVTVHRFDVSHEVEPGVFAIEVACSSGTYVRSLAADLGSALDGGAHLRNLRRTAIGPFVADEARPLAKIDSNALLPARDVFRGRAFVTAEDDELVDDIAHGKVLPRERLHVVDDGPWPVLDGHGELIAVYEAHRQGTVKPSVVLASSQ